MIRSSKRSPLVYLTHATVLFLVIIWTIPTAGLFISSLRDKDQLAVSGWWTALSTSTHMEVDRAEPPSNQVQESDHFVIKGNILHGKSGKISKFGYSSLHPQAYKAGEVAQIRNGQTLQVMPNGDYVLSSPTQWRGRNGKRIFYTAEIPPHFTLNNYKVVLGADGLGQSFINSLTVTIPATVIPILIAAFAAYALAWMRFPGRAILVASVVGLLVVPLQMSLIPLLKSYNWIGDLFGVSSKTYVGIWLAHTGFGLPLAIYLLRNYIVGLPSEIIESARVDGASDFDIFRKIILPLSFPALASFAIFQFLWVWNDLLVAMVFLGTSPDHMVLTGQLRQLMGSLGGNWGILTASAFITIIIPLCVFFGLQRFLVRGLLAGSVK
ncbi:Trehalose transport system permease protein SugB [Marinomonas spartinae]|uniref:Trehalose transport system permease protein SugB n=1 Tax=Marinomonas spartinae TaxID=1792290 RepID=A0A1A8T210_9GAMM|nr:carbohydrate ABC transporter permease [Marinomonas spartinae]SBS24653.1 Trehalose transport system permease protein SugB [Marinomonas spartinae]SBS25539.1 Trehalose transport system permease protein SugB [Marinomonas spartinae]